MRAAELSAELSLSSLDLPRYLGLGRRSVSENKLRLSRIVFMRGALSFSAASKVASGKNFLDKDSTIGSAKIYSQDGR